MKLQHYLIIYKPPRADFDKNATEEKLAIVEDHFEHLKHGQSEGSLVLAGRTDDAHFGIAVIQAKNDGEAKDIMENDPAVKERVFSGELLPFRLALAAEGTELIR